MKQAVKKQAYNLETEQKKLVTNNFLGVVEQLIEQNVIPNVRQFAVAIQEDPDKLHQLKKDGRYVTIDTIAKAVKFGINANKIFAQDEDANEEVLRTGVVINSPVGGDNNGVINNGKTLINGQNNSFVNNGNVYNNVEHLIEQLPKRFQKEITDLFGKIKDNGVTLFNEVDTLKKTLDYYRTVVEEKDRLLVEAQGKIISLMEERLKTQQANDQKPSRKSVKK